MTLPLDRVILTEDVSPPEDFANRLQDHVSTSQDHMSSSQKHVSPLQDHVSSEDIKDSDIKSREQSPPSNHGDQEDSTTIHELSVSTERGPSPRQLDNSTGQLDDGIGPSPQQLDDISPSPPPHDEDKSNTSNDMSSSHDTSSDTVDANMSTSI